MCLGLLLVLFDVLALKAPCRFTIMLYKRWLPSRRPMPYLMYILHHDCCMILDVVVCTHNFQIQLGTSVFVSAGWISFVRKTFYTQTPTHGTKFDWWPLRVPVPSACLLPSLESQLQVYARMPYIYKASSFTAMTPESSNRKPFWEAMTVYNAFFWETTFLGAMLGECIWVYPWWHSSMKSQAQEVVDPTSEPPDPKFTNPGGWTGFFLLRRGYSEQGHKA